jgi:hypothetical protein
MVKFVLGNVSANCPVCGVICSFEYMGNRNVEYGTITQTVPGGTTFYKLLRCAACGRGAMAETKAPTGMGYAHSNELISFYPPSTDRLRIPTDVPDGIRHEFEEAELCGSVGAWRAGSALLRSTLEKTLVASGYTKGSLAARIDEAAKDQAITGPRAKRAHAEVRVLGNDVVHDEWREVTGEEFELAHHYVQRILEDLYDDRPTVEASLIAAGRLKPPPPPS